jgi:hypothetical protein
MTGGVAVQKGKNCAGNNMWVKVKIADIEATACLTIVT